MDLHTKDDGMKTKLQWMKQGFRVKANAGGTDMSTNQTYKQSAVYFFKKEVRKSDAAFREYKEREQLLKSQFDLPLPFDALYPCELPEYFGWRSANGDVEKAVMILDTETSGLDNLCNSMLQLSWQVVDVETWQVLSVHNFYFKWPANKDRVSPKAIALNGLTAGRLEELGTTHLVVALYMLYQDMKSCCQLVGHNISFDVDFILHAVYTLREKSKFSFLSELIDAISNISQYCTMRETLNLCCILSEKGVQGSPYKYPKLSELAQFLQIDFSDLSLHNSSDDVEVTKRCYRKLMENHCGSVEI